VRDDTWFFAVSTGLRVGVEVTCALAAAGVLATITAAQPNRSGSSETVVAGCLNQASENGSLAASPGVRPATPETADDLANLNLPTGAFVLNGATARNAAPSPSPRGDVEKTPGQQRLQSYVLHGDRDKLAAHVGHQVEVSGTVRITDTEKPTGTRIAHIDVRDIRMLAASCPKTRSSPNK
jgi:hypothetical protein